MIIVVTGSIGCGKSTAAQIMVNNTPNGVLYDYDHDVSDLYEFSPFRSELQHSFGTVDKREISDIVFADSSRLFELRDIAQPFIDRSMIKFIAVNQRKNIIMDIPLWFENQMYSRFGCDYIVTIHADETTQVERVIERSGWSEQKIKRVIDSQFPQAIKMQYADYVIPNMTDVSQLEMHVKYFVDTYIKGH